MKILLLAFFMAILLNGCATSGATPTDGNAYSATGTHGEMVDGRAFGPDIGSGDNPAP
jgi:uncharacterized protein YceK